MKKTFIFLAMALMSVACTKDMNDDVVVNNVRDELTISLAPETKVHLTEAEGVYQTVWDTQDKLSVFNFDDANNLWKFNGAAGALSGTISKQSTTGTATGTREDIVILHPYMSGVGITGSTLTDVQIPEKQVYTENSYGTAGPTLAVKHTAGNVMVAWGESADEQFQMKSLLGWVKLAIKGTGTVKSIALASADGEQIAGLATVDYKNLSATLTADDDEAYTKVVLDCGTGVVLDEETTTYFYIGVLPHEFESGLTVTVTGNGEADFSKSTGAVEIKRNTIQEFGVLEYNKAEGVVVEGDKPGPMQFEIVSGMMPALVDMGYTSPGLLIICVDTGLMMGTGEPSGVYMVYSPFAYTISGGASGTITLDGGGEVKYSGYVNDDTSFTMDGSASALSWSGTVTPLSEKVTIMMPDDDE